MFNLAVNSGAAAVALMRADAHFGPSDVQGLVAGIPASTVAGLAGAFFWGAYEAIRRYNAADLSPVSLHVIWLRSLIAAVLGPLVTTPLKPDAALLVAFMLGAFPLQTTLDFFEGQAKKKLDLTATADPAQLPNLHNIQGATATVITALSEIGIESTQHLAYADPMRLLLKTNIEWKAILDIMDQSFLFNYVGEKIGDLRSIGIRGGIELAALGEDLADGPEPTRICANTMVDRLAAILGQTPEGIKNLVEMFHEDSQLNLIWDLWGDLYPEDDEKTIGDDPPNVVTKKEVATSL
ncbi:MAG: hypothetical protein ACLQOO_03035 [Terriglobia bacterium]